MPPAFNLSQDQTLQFNSCDALLHRRSLIQNRLQSFDRNQIYCFVSTALYLSRRTGCLFPVPTFIGWLLFKEGWLFFVDFESHSAEKRDYAIPFLACQHLWQKYLINTVKKIYWFLLFLFLVFINNGLQCIARFCPTALIEATSFKQSKSFLLFLGVMNQFF